MTFEELKAELAARGFDDLSDARLGRYINAARAELDRMHLWPWREKGGDGISPVSVPDLGPVEKVINQDRGDAPLSRVSFSNLVDSYGDLAQEGVPWAYYVAWPDGEPSIATYPISADTIGVQYWRTTPDLEDDDDVPASPLECHYLIIDMAVRRAYRDTDNHEAAAALQTEVTMQLEALLMQYTPGIEDGPDFYMGLTFASDDW